MSAYLLQPCRSKAAFEALPNKDGTDVRLDLSACREILSQLGYSQVCDAKVLIIMEKEIEVTIYPNGKLLLKTDSSEMAKQVMDEIYDKLLPA